MNVGLTRDRGLDAEVRLLLAIVAVLVLVLVSGGIYFLVYLHNTQPVSVLANGVSVATFPNLKAAEQGVAAAEASVAPGVPAGDRHVKEDITFSRLPAGGVIDSPDTAAKRLKSKLHVSVDAWCIVVSGKSIVALPSEDVANAALGALKQHYASMPPDLSVAGKVEFRERVEVAKRLVSTRVLSPSADAAAQALWSAPPARDYTVQQGDTGWRIAHRVHMKFADFLRANSGRDINRLTPGDTVNVGASYPPITVIVKKYELSQQSIGSGSGAGKRQVTSVATYINGEKDGPSVPVSMYLLQRATPTSELQ